MYIFLQIREYFLLYTPLECQEFSITVFDGSLQNAPISPILWTILADDPVILSVSRANKRSRLLSEFKLGYLFFYYGKITSKTLFTTVQL